MRRDLYVIECRDNTGKLDFTEPQPDQVFGMGAITGISENEMASVIFRKLPDAVLTGECVSLWPSLFDPRFTARRKTW